MIGETILHYKILEKLGEGGMGEVFKAQDTKLDRFVALKFLPSQLTASEDDKARFIQEAKAASAMNHPNVCTIHSIEEHDKQLFIVMEYVDGVTLRDNKQILSEKRILEIAAQIADGLGAAHEKGIVHRDIKPENIMLRKDGIAQIMDFGLAKLFNSGNASRLTKAGSTVGTMGYMSPEQVQGLDVDFRTDIFSLGVVLYEMFAGESPFKGMHESAVMYEIVNVEAQPISTIKPEIDPALDEIILECLEKDKDERCQSAKELSRNLRKLKRGSSGSKASRVFQARSFSSGEKQISESNNISTASKILDNIKKHKIYTAVISLLAIAVLFLVFRVINNSPVSELKEPVRFTFDIPGQSNPLLKWEAKFNISQDGNSIAYVDNSVTPSIIKIRSLNNIYPFEVRGTENGSNPVFENSNIITFTLDSHAAKVPLTGGLPEISNNSYSQGYSWGTNGEIVSSKNWGNGLYFQKDWGSKQEALTTIDASKNEGAHIYPVIVPGNKAAVFTIWSKDGTFDDSKIGLVNLKTKEKKNLSYNGIELHGTFPQFISTGLGYYLLYSRNGNLLASQFDLSSLSVTGPESVIIEGILVNSESGKAAYAVSSDNNGVIAYLPGRIDTAKEYLDWVENNGTEKRAISVDGSFLSPSFSKNGTALVLLTGATYKIGIINFKDDKVDMLFANGDNNMPQITPDGTHFVFVSNFENGKYNIYLSRLDGTGGTKKIAATEGSYPETSNLSPDGSKILYTQSISGKWSIWIKDINNDKSPELLFKSGSNFTSPTFSPDGKYISYRSNEIDGKYKLFIRPFPINDVKTQVSIDDGWFAQWSFNGKAIYYRTDDKIFEASIETSPELKITSRKLVFVSPKQSDSYNQSDFALAPDGRILILKNALDVSKPLKMNVIVNWFEELKKKLTGQN